mgnify:CR=1 FL=1
MFHGLLGFKVNEYVMLPKAYRDLDRHLRGLATYHIIPKTPGIYSLNFRSYFDKVCFFERGKYVVNELEFIIFQRIHDHFQKYTDVYLEPITNVIHCQIKRFKGVLTFNIAPMKFEVKIESYDPANHKHRLVFIHN